MSAPVMMGRFEAHTLPDGAEVYFDPGQHRYYSEIKAKPDGSYSFKRGSNLPGVSTIAKFVDPPGDALLHWAARLDQEAIAELAAADLRDKADVTWLGDAQMIRERLKAAQTSWVAMRDKAAGVGNAAHDRGLAELAVGRVPDLDTFSTPERPYLRALINWWRLRSPEILQSEQLTYSASRGYAGRFDLRCRFIFEGELVTVLVDAKTREKGKVRMTDFAQIAGYENSNVECGIGASDQQMVLILMPDGTYREEFNRLDDEPICAPADFLAGLNAYNVNKTLGRNLAAVEKKRVAA